MTLQLGASCRWWACLHPSHSDGPYVPIPHVFDSAAELLANAKPPIETAPTKSWVLPAWTTLVTPVEGFKEGRYELPHCPDNHLMHLRRAEFGIHAGDYFWGCEKFPACRYLIPVKPEAVTAARTVASRLERNVSWSASSVVQTPAPSQELNKEIEAAIQEMSDLYSMDLPIQRARSLRERIHALGRALAAWKGKKW